MSIGGTRLWCNSRAAADSHVAISAHAQLSIFWLSKAAAVACSLLTAMPEMSKLKKSTQSMSYGTVKNKLYTKIFIGCSAPRNLHLILIKHILLTVLSVLVPFLFSLFW